MGLSDVVDQDADIEILNESSESGVIGLVVAGEVHGEDLALDGRALGFNLLGESDELGFGAGDEDEVEALVGELKSILLAHSVGGPCDNSPGALWSILAQL